MSDEEVKTWYSVKKSATSPAVVTCSMVQGNLSSKYAVKAMGNIKAATTEARSHAERGLKELREAVQ